MLRRVLAYAGLNAVSRERNVHGFSDHTLNCLLRAGWIPGRKSNTLSRLTSKFVSPPFPFFHDQASLFLTEFGDLSIHGNFHMLLVPEMLYDENYRKVLAELNGKGNAKFSLLGSLTSAGSDILMESTGKVWAFDDDLWPIAKSGIALIEEVCSGERLGFSAEWD